MKTTTIISLLISFLFCEYSQAQYTLKIINNTFVIEDYEYSAEMDRELEISLIFTKKDLPNTLTKIEFVCGDETDIWCSDFNIVNVKFERVLSNPNAIQYEFEGFYEYDNKTIIKLIIKKNKDVLLILENELCKQIFKKESTLKI